MTSHTIYRTFNTSRRRELVRITDDVEAGVREARIGEGMALICAMHITAGVWINDDEPGLHADVLEWLDKLAPPSEGRLDLGPWQQIFDCEFDGRRPKRLVIKVLGE